MPEMCFIDSSALVKRYLNENGTAWVINLVKSPSVRVSIAHLTVVEVVAAMTRRLPAHQARATSNAFRRDFTSDFAVILIGNEVIERALTLAMKHRLRGYDSIQLSAGMSVLERESSGEVTFIASDLELLQAAKAEGFLIADPNDYP